MDLASIPVDFSPLCRTPSQWTALGFTYEAPPIFPWLPSKPMRLVVEPDYFALAGALNLAAAYHPEVPDVR